MESCCHGHSCKHTSTSQTLNELDFERGPWSAALEGDLERLKSIFEKRSLEVDVLDSAGYTSLHYAARSGKLEVIHYLVSRGSDVNKPTRANRSTALHKAVIAGRLEAVSLLLSSGAHVDAVDAAGHTPVHYAQEAGYSEIVKHLTSHGNKT